MQGFEWAERNLRVLTPEELQGKGVDVYFAPRISPATKVVNLQDGRVDGFSEGQERPRAGFYASFDSLARFCLAMGRPLVETDGQVSLQPTGSGEAGDPLQHEDEGKIG